MDANCRRTKKKNSAIGAMSETQGHAVQPTDVGSRAAGIRPQRAFHSCSKLRRADHPSANSRIGSGKCCKDFWCSKIENEGANDKLERIDATEPRKVSKDGIQSTPSEMHSKFGKSMDDFTIASGPKLGSTKQIGTAFGITIWDEGSRPFRCDSVCSTSSTSNGSLAEMAQETHDSAQSSTSFFSRLLGIMSAPFTWIGKTLLWPLFWY